ncbi:hypothetical protein [Legionella oakridgensis]|nr:hypothetical protein [Legionella oakridgensis]
MPAQLLKTLEEDSIDLDNRAELGEQYGGRTKAYEIIRAIESL